MKKLDLKYTSFDESLDKEKIKQKTKNILKVIGELQYKMYAESKSSLLIIFQGLDASGKDGLTKGLLKYCNPVGISISSFKKPTAEEYAHDFLWRIHKHTPAKGVTQVFIRSHYEDILVPTVNKLFPPELIHERFQMINHFERVMEQNGTKVLKFFLNVSPDVQEERLRERIELKEKHWKHQDSDWDTRSKTEEYLAVYESIFLRCNNIPWHIIPADTNWQKLYFTSKVVLETLQNIPMEWPDLKTIRFK